MNFGYEFQIKSESDLEKLIQFESDQKQSLSAEALSTVTKIFEEIRGDGGSCLPQKVVLQAQKFDSLKIIESNLVVAPKPVSISKEAEEIILASAERVRAFHDAQKKALLGSLTEAHGGWQWQISDPEDRQSYEGQLVRPIERVGIYIPGGRASYPSSVIMNVIPALAAGVKEIVIATPALENGELLPEIEWTANLLGVRQILKVGGAAAIASLAYGIDGLLFPVHLIAGPGNSYVNQAKRLVWGSVGVDMLAGPSEVAIVVDGSGSLDWAAADLFTQIEHAPDNVGRVYCLGASVSDLFKQSVQTQLESLSRKEIVVKSLKNSALITFAGQEPVENVARALNSFAPEHLSIQTVSPDRWLHWVQNAGCISLGSFGAQSFGDYATGPSHTLPTAGAAKFASPVSILTFLKVSSLSYTGPELAKKIAPIAAGMAQLEGFQGHGYGALVRQQGE